MTLRPSSVVISQALLALVTMLACVACDASASSDAKPKADKPEAAFELTARHRLLYTSKVVETEKAKETKDPGVDFGVIPITPIGLKPYYNVFTKSVESRPVPGNPHKIPVLRAPHVQAFKDKPDAARLALDQVAKFDKEAQLDGTQKFVVVSNGTPDGVRLISLTEITIPQDKDDQWRLRGTIEPLKLPEHIDDPIADRGRAVLTKEPLPLKGRLVFGTRKQSFGPAEVHTVELPGGKPQKIGDTIEPRISAGTGSVADRVESRDLRITDKSGKPVGEIKLESDIAEFAVSPDGKFVALCTERYVEVPNDIGRRELVTMVYTADGKRKVIEFLDYDDPAFMPDGNLLLTPRSAGDGLFVGDVKTGKVTPIKIQDAPDAEAAGPHWPRQPAVSPDGKWVAYVSGRGVFVVGIDGKGWTPVWTPETEQEPQSQPVFSPDSRFLACVITPLNVMTGPGQVVVFDWHKHVRQPLPITQGADSEGPLVWQP